MKQLQRQLKVLGLVETANVDQVDAAYQQLQRAWHAQLDSGDWKKQQVAAQNLEALEDAYKLVRPFAKPVNGDDWADRMAFVGRPEAAPVKASRVHTPDDSRRAADAPWGPMSAPRVAKNAGNPWGSKSSLRVPLGDTPCAAASPVPVAPRKPIEDEAPDEYEHPQQEVRMEDARKFLMAARLAAKQRRDLRAALRWRQNLRVVSFILLLPGLVGVPALVAADVWHQHTLHQRTPAVTAQPTPQAPCQAHRASEE